MRPRHSIGRSAIVLGAGLALIVSLGGVIGVSSTTASGESTTPWSLLTQLPPEYDPVAASCAPGTSTCVAFGRIGSTTSAVLWSADGGATWQQQTLDVQLNDVSCATATDCVAVGDDAIEVTTDGGATWSAASAPSDQDGGTLVSCTSAGDCVATDVGSGVVASSDGGAIWTSVAGQSAVTENLRSLSCWSETDCAADSSSYVETGVPNHVEVTVNRGVSWVVQTLPTFAGAESGADALGGLSCTSSGTCMVVGSTVAFVGSGFGSTGAGTWSNDSSELTAGVPASTASHLVSVGCAPTGALCAAFPSSSASTTEVAVTTDLGTAWTSATTTLTAPLTLGASCTGATDCLGAGTGQRTGVMGVTTTTDRTTWTQSSGIPQTFGRELALSCASTTKCVLFGDGTTGVGNGGDVILTSADGGASWSFASLPSGLTNIFTAGIVGLSCPKSTTLCVAAVGISGDTFDLSGSLLTSTDGGRTWSVTTPVGSLRGGHNGGSGPVSCGSSTFCMAILGANEYATADAGSSWAKTTASPDLSPGGLSCWAPDDCMVVGDDTSTVARSSSVTTNGGASWSVPSPIASLGNGTLVGPLLECTTATDCVDTVSTNEYGTFSNFAATTNGGTTWSLVSTDSGIAAELGSEGEYGGFGISSLSCGTSSQCMAVGSANPGASGSPAMPAELTGNGGVSWENESVTTSLAPFGGVSAVSCPATGQCDAVSSGTETEVLRYQSAAIAPTARPTKLSASLTGTHIHVSWTDVSTSTVTAYVVAAIDTTTDIPVGSVTVPATATTTTVTPGVTTFTDSFTINVSAANDGGTGPVASTALGLSSTSAPLSGTVTTGSTTTPVAKAPVQVCDVSVTPANCLVVETTTAGTWSTGALPDGTYVLTASAPAGANSTYGESSPVTATVTGTTPVTVPALKLPGYKTLKAENATVTTAGGVVETTGEAEGEWAEPEEVTIATPTCPATLCAVSAVTVSGYEVYQFDEPTTENAPITGDTFTSTATVSATTKTVKTATAEHVDVPPVKPLHGPVKVAVSLSPYLGVRPNSVLRFGNVLRNGTPKTIGVRFQALGTKATFSVTLSGTPEYSITRDMCTHTTLPTGSIENSLTTQHAECVITVTLTPTITFTGRFVATLEIKTPVGTRTVPLVGYIVTAPAPLDEEPPNTPPHTPPPAPKKVVPSISVEPATGSESDFGEWTTYDTAYETFTITNDLTPKAVISTGGAITLDTPDGVSITQSTLTYGTFTVVTDATCTGATLKPGQSCDLTVAYTAESPIDDDCTGTYFATATLFAMGTDHAGTLVDDTAYLTASVTTSTTFGTCTPTPSPLTQFIDPSGTVTYTTSTVTTPQPYAGATVTLSTASSKTGPFTMVPAGSDVMSPSNRTNPVTSDALGQFGWTTLAGWYEVSASGASTCTPVTTTRFYVPPPQTDLVLNMKCGVVPVVRTTTSTTLSANAATSVEGAGVTFTAQVTSGVGTVEFKDGKAVLGTGIVESGVATLTTSGLLVGGNTITAYYSGDAGHSASTSNVVTVDVLPAPTPRAPVFVLDTPPTTATVGQLYSYGFRATGAAKYSLSGAPAWLTISPYNGTVTGTPPKGTTTFSYTVIATNPVATTPTVLFTIGVSSPTANTVTVTNPGNQTTTVGTSVGLQMTATDSTSGQTLTYSATGLPAGLSIASSGLISGEPTAAGTYSVTVTAKDTTGASGSASFTWAVGPKAANTVTVTNPGNQTTTVGTSVGLQMTATDSTSGQTLTYSATGLPAGLSIASSGLISGEPTAAGTYSVTVTAKDTTGASGSASFTWAVGPKPANTVTVTNPGNQTTTVGTSVGLQMTATDSTSGQTLTYSATGLPAGLSIASSGLISGEPTAAGTYSVTVTAKDTTGASGSASFTWTVGPKPATGLEITSPTTSYFAIGKHATFAITATGTPPIKMTESGRLPRGLSFKTTGGGTATLLGTTITLGTYHVTIAAKSSVTSVTQKLTIVVGFAPVFLTPSSATFAVGKHGTFVVGTVGYPAATLTKTGTLPAGLTFTTHHNGTATISGSPAAATAATYHLTLIATNGLGTTKQGFTVVVGEAPAFTSTSSTTFTAGVPTSFTVSASGYPAPKITEWGTLPKGVSFKTHGDGKATISGTPATEKKTVYKLKLTATNGVGRPVVQTFVLTVTVADRAPTFTSPDTATVEPGSVTIHITATGSPAPRITESGSLPKGLSFHTTGTGTATITGSVTASEKSTYKLRLTATNAVGTSTQSLMLVVNQSPHRGHFGRAVAFPSRRDHRS